MAPRIEVDVVRSSTEGAGVGALPDGRVLFVDGALPGERVSAEVVSEARRHARATTVEVLTPHDRRVAHHCPQAALGCGGCDLGHASVELQRELKRRAIADAFERIGRLDSPEVRTVALPAAAHRTTVRAGVTAGRAGFRARRSDRVVPVDRCLVAHPLVDELITEGRFGDAVEVTLRVGARTGERLALVDPSASGVHLPADVTVIGEDERASGRTAWIHEEIHARRFRVSAGSFFQARPDGAEALVEEVRAAVGAHVPKGVEHLVDVGAGVGLFAALVPSERVTAVERNRSAAADARANLDPARSEVVEQAVEVWTPVPADVVVADPSRAGLGADGCRVIAATGAPLVVLVSCDAAAGARDVAALVRDGYGVASVTLVDLFPHTHHVEVVTVLVR
jgi:23S rRNA (uracil1939-C5)-methyltransferase